MFYFLEGAGSRPVCRNCLARQETEAAPDAGFWSELRGLEMATRSGTGAVSGGLPGPGDLTDAVRSLLVEELDRIGAALERTPESEPDLPLLWDLEKEARQHLRTGQLSAALLALRDLRRIFSGRENARAKPPLCAPWDESVEVLFDRVMARSRAMTRKSPAAEAPDESGEILSVTGRYRGTEAPS